MNKRFLFYCVLLISAVVLFQCGSRGPTKGYIEGETQVIMGWSDDGNEFMVMGEGVWSDDNNNAKAVVRRNEARQQALLNAQAMVVEKFVGAAITGAALTKVNDAGAKGYIEKKFAGFIKGGSIVKETWNTEEGMSLFYTVTGNNLRKTVETSFRDLTPEEKAEINPDE